MSIVTWLQFGSAACAFAAAGFWAWSASGEAPKMTFKGVDDLMPYLTRSTLRNRWAAGFAGASAFLAGLATLWGIL
jgi:hypothetical protein